MIISASRRTDIPAWYPEWFMNRLRAGEVLVPNPYNRKKVNRHRSDSGYGGLYRILEQESGTDAAILGNR